MTKRKTLPSNEPDKIVQVSIGIRKKHVDWIKAHPDFNIHIFTRDHLEWYIKQQQKEFWTEEVIA